MSDEWLTVQEVQDRLGISRWTVYRLIDRDLLTAVKDVSTKRVFIRPDSVAAFETDRLVPR